MDNKEHEHRIALFEAAQNAARDEYFSARHQMFRTINNERLFDAGYRMAWNHFTGQNVGADDNLLLAHKMQKLQQIQSEL